MVYRHHNFHCCFNLVFVTPSNCQCFCYACYLSPQLLFFIHLDLCLCLCTWFQFTSPPTSLHSVVFCWHSVTYCLAHSTTTLLILVSSLSLFGTHIGPYVWVGVKLKSRCHPINYLGMRLQDLSIHVCRLRFHISASALPLGFRPGVDTDSANGFVRPNSLSLCQNDTFYYCNVGYFKSGLKKASCISLFL